MAVCIMTGSGHSLKPQNDPFLLEILKTSSRLILASVDVNNLTVLPVSISNESTTNHEFKTFSASSGTAAMFQLKQHLDKSRILEAKILVPLGNIEECETLKSLLFPQVYKITVGSFSRQSPLRLWKQASFSEADTEITLKQYISTLSSHRSVEIVCSSRIPSDMFIHGYSKRYGGVSTWPGMDSLNMVYSLRKPDTQIVVQENARRLCLHMGRDPSKFHLAKANHGKNIWVYEKLPPEAYDGIITRTPGVTVASPAADCNMLLLADPVAKACGAIHAGWKGILLGVIEVAVEMMVLEYTCNVSNIIASLGPSLSVCCCEFGAAESKEFLQIDEKVVVWKGGEKPHLDLRLAARILLEKSGIKPENIDSGTNGSNPTSSIAVCTKCDPNQDFFSYRRDGQKFGNQVGFICLK